MTFPISNRPTSLQVDYFYLQRIVGQYLQYGFNAAEWDDEQAQAVDEVIDQGCRSYYYPPALPDGYVHEWSFMRPTHTFDTTADQRKYPLPVHWERPLGHLTHSDSTTYPAIPFTASSRLRVLNGREQSSGTPRLAATEPQSSTGEETQIQILVLHPTPDATYTLSVQFQAHGRKLSSAQPHPLGGQIHGDGILAACLAVAEMRTGGGDGQLQSRFLQVVTSNIARDHNRGAKILGYNGNYSNWISGRGTMRRMGGLFYGDATYGGNSYPGE